MNLYLVLALALGAVSPAPPVQPAVSNVVAESRLQSQRTVPFAVRRSPLAVRVILGQRPTANGQRVVDTPLTGAATPRAPASSR